MNSPFRGGMQVHAVPPEERAFDSRGQQLPWGYAYSDANQTRKQAQPLEKGPFGRATNKRSSSRRVRTVTPAPTREDVARQENNQFADEIFSNYRNEMDDRQAQAPQAGSTAGQTKGGSLLGPGATSRGPRMSTVEGGDQQAVSSGPIQNAAPGTTSAPVSSQPTLVDPTELLIYGFGADFQPDAIAYFERVTRSSIYEDYDRAPPEARFATPLSSYNALHTSSQPAGPQQQQSFGSQQQPNSQQTFGSSMQALTAAARRKINTYVGGTHWIKVTLPTPEAAAAAIDYSPTVQHGYLVHTELYRGSPPSIGDVAIPANGNLSGANTFMARRPGSDSRSSRPFNSMPSRTRNSMPGGLAEDAVLEESPSQDSTLGSLNSSPTASSATATGVDASAGAQGSGSGNELHQRTTASPVKSLRIPTATRAVLKPANEALLPVPPWTQRAFGHIPIVGWLFFGGDTQQQQLQQQAPKQPGPGAPQGSQAVQGGVLGSAVPRKDEGTGTFDWDKASFWWRMCYWLDSWTGSDLCGIKGDE